MAAILEVKYYNSFWLKKIKTLTGSGAGSAGANRSVTNQDQVNKALITVNPSFASTTAGQGSEVIIQNGTTGEQFTGYIFQLISNTTFILNEAPLFDIEIGNNTCAFGGIVNFAGVPQNYISTPESDWFIEEARIRGGYNNTNIDYGVRAYAVDENTQGEIRDNALIYSGIYNSRTGVNNTNQFPVGSEITKAVDPAYGSIQKLYAEDSNLIIFQEDKVSRALIDKDAIYSAEGGGTVTSSNLVIGVVQPYGGEYGISTEPESFAVYGYRKYFTDRKRNAVLRLSMDGIEEISRYGMTDYFRDSLSTLSSTSKIVGGYDLHTKKYDISLLYSGQFAPISNDDYDTLSFDESVKGWTSFYTYAPDFIASLKNKFYSFKKGGIWQHYNNAGDYSTFYNVASPSKVTFIFNPKVSMVKVFKTINYEGSEGWEATSITTSQNQGVPITQYVAPNGSAALQAQLFSNQFINKEDKYFANINNNTPQQRGAIVFGNSMTGVRGFFSTVEMSLTGTNATQSQKELFAVSTEYVESSY
jgi:hypothetical protein